MSPYRFTRPFSQEAQLQPPRGFLANIASSPSLGECCRWDSKCASCLSRARIARLVSPLSAYFLAKVDNIASSRSRMRSRLIPFLPSKALRISPSTFPAILPSRSFNPLANSLLSWFSSSLYTSALCPLSPLSSPASPPTLLGIHLISVAPCFPNPSIRLSRLSSLYLNSSTSS